MVPYFWLRNYAGEKINLSPVTPFHFCRMSVSNVRQWFDEKHPDVTFGFDGDKLSKVSVRGCDGREVEFRAAE
jgi:hypothetical protein